MKLSNVMIYFDQALYETPPIIVKLEEELDKLEKTDAPASK